MFGRRGGGKNYLRLRSVDFFYSAVQAKLWSRLATQPHADAPYKRQGLRVIPRYRDAEQNMRSPISHPKHDLEGVRSRKQPATNISML